MIPTRLQITPEVVAAGLRADSQIREANGDDEGDVGASYANPPAHRIGPIIWGYIIQSAFQVANGGDLWLAVNRDGRRRRGTEDWQHEDGRMIDVKLYSERWGPYIRATHAERHPDWLFVFYDKSGLLRAIYPGSAFKRPMPQGFGKSEGERLGNLRP